MRQPCYTCVRICSQDAQLQLVALVAAGVQKRDVFAAATSGSKTAIERPGMKYLRKYAEEGYTVVVWRVDRVGRSRIDVPTTVTLRRGRGIHVRADGIDPNSTGALILKMLATLAEYECELSGGSTPASQPPDRVAHALAGRCPNRPSSRTSSRSPGRPCQGPPPKTPAAPKTNAEQFPEVKRLLDLGLQSIQYTFSGDNLSEAGKLYRGASPSNDGTELSTDVMPEGFPMTISPERREEFAPGLDADLLALIQATAEVEMKDADSPKEPSPKESKKTKK